MTSREIVRRTLEFDHPERVARSFKPSDMISGGPQVPNPAGEWIRINDREWQRTDEWGNVWRRIDDTSKGEIFKGAVDDLDKADSFPVPDFNNPEYYAEAKKRFDREPDKWHIGGIHGFTFSVARKLRRMDQYLMDIILEKERIGRLNDRVDEQIHFQIDQIAKAGADCIMVAEDWGTQDRTLISPEMWRDEFKPRLKRICDHTHRTGMKVFMHSCGKITAIVRDLIECGVDLLQFDQPRLHGIDILAAFQQEAKITFWCPVDIQTTLQTTDEGLIRREARELLYKLWRDGRGGFIAGYYGDNASIGLDPSVQEWASDEFLKCGKAATAA